ncbi:hypothetical protein OUHCRE14_45910 [Enterobacter hormaechei subsp. hoffmannii]
MDLAVSLIQDFKEEGTISDKNNGLIVSGNKDDLFDMLGYYFLDLKVISNDRGMINVDIDLGGQK